MYSDRAANLFLCKGFKTREIEAAPHIPSFFDT